MQAIANLVGKQFQDGGRGPDVYDCWGLAADVFRRCGTDLPDYKISCDASPEVSAQMSAERPNWQRCDVVKPVPSLIVFSDRGLCAHCGVYIGNGRFIHAHERNGVEIVSVNHPFWKNRIEGFYIPRWGNAAHSTGTKPDPPGKPG